MFARNLFVPPQIACVLLMGTLVSSLAHQSSLSGGEPVGALVGFAIERTWSDQSGRFKIEGKLKSATTEEVQLVKSDGNVLKVALDKLSQADQGFVNTFLNAEKALGVGAANPTSDPENPFTVVEPMPIGGAETAVPQSIAVRRTIVTGMRPFAINAGRPMWNATPTLAFPEITLEEILTKAPLPSANLKVAAAGNQGIVLLNSYQQSRTPEESFSNFAFVSAKTGDASENFHFDQPWKLMAISPNGTRVAAVRIEGFDKGNDVAILSIVNGQVQAEFQFKAGGGAWDELHWVAFLPDNRLATISQKHDLTFWDLSGPAGPKAIRRGSTGGALNAEITAAGEMLALSVGSSIVLVDTVSGRTMGCIARDTPANRFVFSPDGQSIAAFHPFNVTLYSMVDGKESRSFAVSENNPNTRINWVGKHLLVGSVVYNAENGVPLWTYEGNPPAQVTLGNYLISGFGSGRESTVSVLKIPHEEALQASSNINPNDIYSIQPGDSIAVEFDFGATPANVQQEIRQSVDAKLQQLGWHKSSSSANLLEIKLAQGARDEAEYYTQQGFGPMYFPPGFGGGFGGRPSGPAEKVSFQAWTHALEISAHGSPIFKTQQVFGAPQHLQSKENESTQAAVDRICSPQPGWFKSVAIPPHLLKPEFQGGLGKSKVTEAGLR